jgi:hypothetical protein
MATMLYMKQEPCYGWDWSVESSAMFVCLHGSCCSALTTLITAPGHGLMACLSWFEIGLDPSINGIHSSCFEPKSTKGLGQYPMNST